MAAGTDSQGTCFPLSQHLQLRGAKQAITIQCVENLVSSSGLVFLRNNYRTQEEEKYTE